MVKRRIFAAGMIVGLLSVTASGKAAILAKDDFENYPSGAPLTGQNGGLGWAGAWLAAAGSTTNDVAETTANPLSFIPGGGAVLNGQTRAGRAWSTVNGGVGNNPAAARQLATPLDVAFYIAFLTRYETTGGGAFGNNNTFSLHLANSATNTATLNFGLRAGAGTNHFMVRNGTGTPLADDALPVKVETGRTYLLVARFSRSPQGTFDRVDFWLDPGHGDAGSPDLTLNLAAGAGLSSFTHLFFRSAANEADDRYFFDNLVIATSWEEVVPLPSGPPVIDNLSPPDGATGWPPTNGLHFTASSTEPISPAGLRLVLNGADVSADLVIGGATTNRTVWFTNLVPNTNYTAEITVSNATGLSTVVAQFDTIMGGDPAPLAVESFEDYPSGATLLGLNGGTGWAGAWAGGAPNNDFRAVDTSGTPLNFTPAGGWAIHGGTRAAQIAVGGYQTNSRALPPLPEVFYAAFLARVSAGDWSDTDTFSLHLANSSVNMATPNFGLRGPGTFMLRVGVAAPEAANTLAGSTAAGSVNYLVCRVSKLDGQGNPSATYDRFELWLNPGVDDVYNQPQGMVRMQLTAGAGLTAFSHLILRTAALEDGDAVQCDHILLATNWAQVVGAPQQNPPPQVALAAPAPGAVFAAPADIPLTAVAADANGTVARVEFFAGPLKLGEATNSPYSLVWSNVAAGLYALTARATDNEGAVATSAVVFVTVREPGAHQNGVVSGELKKWHRVSVTFDGPFSSETATPNPFRDYRLNVTFTHWESGRSFLVPGFFAADGHAAETGADAGDQWRVHFAPDATGEWIYLASFRSGPDVATNLAPEAGTPVSFDGATGRFTIAPTDKTGRDHRAKGRLQYVGRHHLRFAETGEYFLKAGADSPENLLAYADFDDTPNVGGARKTWSPHAAHYQPTEAAPYTWRGGRGTNLLGALKYLADQGMNAFSFLTFSVDGDDKNVFPHRLTGSVAAFEAAGNNRWDTQLHHDRFDVSKMEQWDRIFDYGDHLGFYLHFKMMETENELKMDGGNLGVERALYYRELIARYGHHLALNWNLGEEIDSATTAQKKAWSQHIHDLDPYHHLQVIHNGANHFDLLGSASKVTGFSLQTGPATVFSSTLTYLHRSATSGVPWVVANDEQNPANDGIITDAEDFYHDSVRGPILWGNLLAGGAGIETYFGYSHPQNDLNAQDWNSRSNWWNQCRYALEFFRQHAVPFWAMTNRDDLLTGGGSGAHCLAQTGRVYVVYLPAPVQASLNLAAAAGSLTVDWFDPRRGGALQTGAVSRVSGGGVVSLGLPPATSTNDWVALVRARETFAGWRNRWFSPGQLADPDISGPEADPDGDGLGNAVEFALGGDPLVAEPEKRPLAAIEGGHLTLTYRRRTDAEGVTWVAEVADTLNAGLWQSGGPHLTEEAWVESEYGERVRLRDNTPVSWGWRRFLRLRVIMAP